MPKTATPRRGMSRRELLNLPASVDTHTAFRALGIGTTRGYRLIKDGEFPVRVLRLGGHAYRVPTADLLELLGIDPSEREHNATHTPASSGNGAASGHPIRGSGGGGGADAA